MTNVVGMNIPMKLTHPVTVREYRDFLNEPNIDNFSPNNEYRLYNIFNPDLPLQYDGTKYYCDESKYNYPITGVTLWGAVYFARLRNLRLPSELDWRTIIGQNKLQKSIVSKDDLQKQNISDRFGCVKPVFFNRKCYNDIELIGNVSHWCVPNDLNQKECDESQLACISAPVGGCAWNKGAADSDDDWVYSRWANTGAVGVGFRCLI